MVFWRLRMRRDHDPHSGLRRRLTRLRRLNRCYRELLSLFLDAAEKQGGGFIFDRQYVVSLGERAFRLGYEIVFHSNVLQPGVALESYAVLDRRKADLRDLLAGRRPPPGEKVTGDPADASPQHLHGGTPQEEPEDRLLDDVLRQMGSPFLGAAHPEAPAGDRRLCGIVQHAYVATLGHLVAGCLDSRLGIPVAAPGFLRGIRTLDLSSPVSGGQGEAGMPDPSAWLLAGLLSGAGDGEDAIREAGGMVYRWEESATALLLAEGRTVLLDAVITGDAGGSHVMAVASAGAASGPEVDLEGMQGTAARLGLVAVRTAGAVVAWQERIPPASAREVLTRVGQLAHRITLGPGAARVAAGRG